MIPKVTPTGGRQARTHLKGERESWKAQTRANALFVSTAIQLNAESLERPFDWLRRGLRTILEVDSIGPYTASRLGDDDWKGRVMAFLEDADLGLEDVEAEEKSAFETGNFKSLPKERQRHLKSIFPEWVKTLEVFTYRKDDTGAKNPPGFR